MHNFAPSRHGTDQIDRIAELRHRILEDCRDLAPSGVELVDTLRAALPCNTLVVSDLLWPLTGVADCSIYTNHGQTSNPGDFVRSDLDYRRQLEPRRRARNARSSLYRVTAAFSSTSRNWEPQSSATSRSSCCSSTTTGSES